MQYPSRFRRVIRSLWDGYRFFELALSPNRSVLICLIVLGALVSVIVAVINPRVPVIGGAAFSGLLFAVAGAIRFGTQVLRPKDEQFARFQDNLHILDQVRRSKPDDQAVACGYEVYDDPSFEGAVHLSRRINRDTLRDPAADLQLERHENSARYDEIIASLRKDGATLRRFGWQLIRSKLFSRLPLVNEEKAALANDILADTAAAEIYHSTYFATRLSGEICLKDWKGRAHGAEDSGDWQRGRAPFKDDKSGLAMDFNDESQASVPVLNGVSCRLPPLSGQLGTNISVITSDNKFLVAFQGDHNLQAPGSRVPFATGSIDWQDAVASTTLTGLLELSATREMTEEWASKQPQVDLALNAFVPLGYFRVPGRGGKPELCGFGTINISFADLMPNPDEVEKSGKPARTQGGGSHFDVDSIDKLLTTVTRIIEDPPLGKVPDSASLYGSLLSLKFALEEKDARLLSVLNAHGLK